MSRFIWPLVLLALAAQLVRGAEPPPLDGRTRDRDPLDAGKGPAAVDELIRLEFAQGLDNLASAGGRLVLHGGLGRNDAGHLEFTTADQWAELD